MVFIFICFIVIFAIFAFLAISNSPILNYFKTPYNIVVFQDDIQKRIKNKTPFSYASAIRDLKNQLLVNLKLWGLNAIYWNNIAIRNNILLSVLYSFNGRMEESKERLERAKQQMKYCFTANGEWVEGTSYFLYVEEMVNLYLEFVGVDQFLIEWKEKGRAWIKRYMTPDNGLPPIGETRRVNWEDKEYDRMSALTFDANQTLFKRGDLYVLVRHPSEIYKYKWNGHTHFDVCNVVIYYKDFPVILPTGYPGYANKLKFKLYEIENQNSIVPYEMHEPFWRLGYYRLNDITRTDNSIRISYLINDRWVERTITVDKNGVLISDEGVEVINLNVDLLYCDIAMIEGKKLSIQTGLHNEGNTVVLKNERVVIKATPNRAASVLITFKEP